MPLFAADAEIFPFVVDQSYGGFPPDAMNVSEGLLAVHVRAQEPLAQLRLSGAAAGAVVVKVNVILPGESADPPTMTVCVPLSDNRTLKSPPL